MATLTRQQILNTGTTVTFAAAAAAGDKCLPGDTTWIEVVNGSGSAVTVTVNSQTPSNYGTDEDLVVAAATGNPADALTFTVPRYTAQGVIECYVASWDMVATGHDLAAILAAVQADAPATIEVPKWAAGQPVTVGTQRWYDNVLYRCVQAHTTQSGWTPNVVPALWTPLRADLAPWVQPTGVQDAYPIGARVTYNGRAYESKIAANVWSPAAYPAGWTDLGPAV